jgi:hypothetical protein
VSVYNGVNGPHAELFELGWEGPVMTEMIEPMPAAIDQAQLARELVERARAEGVELVGPGGLLTGLCRIAA